MAQNSTLKFDQGVITLTNCDEVNLPRPAKWVWHSDGSRWVANASEYGKIQPGFKVRTDALIDEVPRWQRLGPLAQGSLPTLRPDQLQAIDAWRKTGRGLIKMPTGTGKTEVALTLINLERKSTLIVAPTRDIMYQWHRRIRKGLGYQTGIIGDNHHTILPISVATYHSACIHAPKLGDQFEMIFFDEVHHLTGRVRADAARMCAAPYRLGLSATPPTDPNRLSEIIDLIGPMVFDLDIHDAKGKTLADYQIVPCPVEMSDEERIEYDYLADLYDSYMSEKRKTNRNYNIESLSADMCYDYEARMVHRAYHKMISIENRSEAKFRVLEDLFLLYPTTPTIIWVGSNEMARAITRQFLIPCLLSHCGADERAWVLDGFSKGQFMAITSCKLLTQGVDLPSAKLGIVLGGTASETEETQKLGRLLRMTENNSPAILYEVYCMNSSDAARSKARMSSSAFKNKPAKRHPNADQRDSLF